MAKNHQNIVIQYTVSLTALSLSDVGFTAAQIAGAVGLAVSTTGAGVRYLANGDAPTATKGHLIDADKTAVFNAPGLVDLQVIREAGVDATVTFELETFEAV